MAHVAGLLRFDDVAPPGHHEIINIGAGDGTTVRELVAAFEEVTHRRLRTVDTGPRPGDVCGCYCCGDKAARLLGWRPRYGVRDGLRHAMQWEAVRDRVMAGPVTVAGAR
jgi:UDP-glucose 4-epimerase